MQLQAVENAVSEGGVAGERDRGERRCEASASAAVYRYLAGR